jgi:hypothetical protein
MEIKEGGKIIPVDAERASFAFEEGTIGVFDVKKGKYILQATTKSLRLVECATG